MATLINFPESDEINPLDIVESFAESLDWSLDRQSEDELTASIPGDWCNFHLWCSWRPELGALQLSCVLDTRIPEKNHGDLAMLLVRMNEQMMVGHFDLWGDEGLVMFRHALLLGPDGIVGDEQLSALFEIAFSECQRFYPALQFMLWGGKSVEDALEAALLEPMGEA